MRAANVPTARIRNLRLGAQPMKTPAEVVAWHGAIQAQDYGPSQWSIAQRAHGLSAADVDRALARGPIIRTHVLRPTWHFVARQDARLLLGLTGHRIIKQAASRYRDLHLDTRTLARAQKTILKALEGGNQLTRQEIVDVLEKSRVDTSGQRIAHILMFCELDLAICSGARQRKNHAYAAFDERVPPSRDIDREDAIRTLVRRYFQSHGPATAHDLRWWSGLGLTEIRTALDDLGSEIAGGAIDGHEMWWSSNSPTASSSRGAHLLQTYDEYIVGYTKTRFLGDPRAESVRTVWAGRGPLRGLVLAGSKILGHWRRTMKPTTIEIEVGTYETASSATVQSIQSEANKLGRFFGRNARINVRVIR